MFFFSNFLKFLVLMTPFFVLSMFLSMTLGWDKEKKKELALHIGFAACLLCLALIFGGRMIFELFGITLDAFRIGGGAVLFLSAVGLINSNVLDKKHNATPIQKISSGDITKIAVVPLAIPVTVGPATIGAVMIASAEASSFSVRLVLAGALTVAILILTGMLLLSAWFEEKVGINTIIVLSKLTGLVLAAIAAHMIFTGATGYLTQTITPLKAAIPIRQSAENQR